MMILVLKDLVVLLRVFFIEMKYGLFIFWKFMLILSLDSFWVFVGVVNVISVVVDKVSVVSVFFIVVFIVVGVCLMMGLFGMFVVK